MSFEFDTDTAVHPAAASAGARSDNQRFTAQLTDRWNINDKPNGGYALAIATRAMGAAIPEHPHPFTITGHYLRPCEPGPAEIDVEVVRTGRKLATVAASFTQSGKERLRLVGTFGDFAEATGPSVIRGTPPVLPPVDACERRGSLDETNYPLSKISVRTDTLLDPATGWVTGKPSGVADVVAWIRFADGRPPDVSALPFFADALPPALFEVLDGAVWVPTIELTVHIRAVPAPGWLRASMKTRFLMNGYFEEDGEIWDSTDTLVAQSRQFGMLFRP